MFDFQTNCIGFEAQLGQFMFFTYSFCFLHTGGLSDAKNALELVISSWNADKITGNYMYIKYSTADKKLNSTKNRLTF